MTDFGAFRPIACSHLIDDNDEDKKVRRYKKVCHKKENLNLKNINIV